MRIITNRPINYLNYRSLLYYFSFAKCNIIKLQSIYADLLLTNKVASLLKMIVLDVSEYSTLQ